MCKLAYARTRDSSAYSKAIDMISFQENVVAGQSTGFTFRYAGEFKTRKAIGKVNSLLAKYPDKPSSKEVLGHSRWASVGVISLDNQHPISIMNKNSKIGYGIHNGTFNDYHYYEHYRRDGMVNKTDSALLFSIFSRVLEDIGDNKFNRLKAFSYIMSLIRNESNHNLIIMFKDGQVLFGGNKLTYFNSNEKVGIMTFGFEDECDDKSIYEVRQFDIKKFRIEVPNTSIVRKKSNKKITRPRYEVTT